MSVQTKNTHWFQRKNGKQDSNDMDKIARLRQEIERHRQAIRVLNEHTAPEQMSKTCAIFQYSDSILSELLLFLDTLSEEPDKSPEEAAEEQAKSFGYMSQDVEFKENVESFIAGAEWQASQMPMPEDTILFQKGVAEGRRLEREDMMKDGNVILAEEDFDAEKEKSMEWGYNLCKQQMLKDAVEGEVYLYYSYKRKSTAILVDIPIEDLGDKVRIIVLKEEEE